MKKSRRLDSPGLGISVSVIPTADCSEFDRPRFDCPRVPHQKIVLGGGFKYFSFSPLPGEMIQFD